jgi:hypothetical protein
MRAEFWKVSFAEVSPGHFGVSYGLTVIRETCFIGTPMKVGVSNFPIAANVPYEVCKVKALT